MSIELSRRQFLGQLGSAAACGALGVYPKLALAAQLHGGGMLAPLPAHHRAKAKNLLVVFLTGGFSHLDTFDPKPRLEALDGKPIPAFGLRADEARPLPLLRSKFQFATCGQSGLSISELFPNLRGVADHLCVIRSMHTDIVEHFQGTLAMHTGSATVPMPSLGSWLSYGLGTTNANLPPYVVLAEFLPYAGAQVWDAGFLPAEHQGIRLVPGAHPIAHLEPLESPVSLRQLEETMLRDYNQDHERLRPGDLNLSARTHSFEVARGMMREAPAVFDLRAERQDTLALYGLAPGDNRSFAWQCVIARRLLERGVRVVEIIDTGSHDNWDSHGDMETHRPKALRVDRALAALITDLQERGMLEETLLAICTEFGRTPWSDGGNGKGRNHFAKAFTCLLAGAGVRGGMTYGKTDEFGSSIVEDPCHVHDYHATILHLMGVDHQRLTYRYGGRDFRLTDVAGQVIRPILA